MKLLCERVKAERAKQDEAAEDRAKDSSNLTLNTWPHFSSPHSARRPSGLFLPLSPFASPVSFTFVPCAMHGPCVRAFLPSFFLPFDSLVPLHTDSEVFPQLLWGWMEEKGRAKWWFQWHSFLPCRSRRARVGVWRYVRESVDGFEAEIFFLFF